MSGPFVLRHLIRQVLDERQHTDPGAIAAEVMKRIPREATRVALWQTMRLYVRQVISEDRISNGNVVTSGKAPRSWKVAAIRDNWQRRLNDPVHVGGGKWKTLAECTYTDLLFLASERRELAARNNRWAKTYEAWAKLVQEAEVETFGDLPVETQAKALAA